MIATVPQAVPVKSIPLAPGDRGIAQTVAVMHSLIDRGAVDPQIREQALGIVRQAGALSRDPEAEISAIFAWVKSHMRFQRDVTGGEYVCAAPYLLKTLAGDCDDYVVLTGALLKSLGIPVRIVTIAADREEPGRMSHVYMEASAKGNWIPLDGTQAQSYPGWQPPRYFRKKVWESPRLNPRGLGDLNSDLQSLSQVIGTATQGAATIIAAQNPPAIPGYRYTGVQPVAGSGTVASSYAPTYGVSTFGTISPWIIVGAAAVLIALVVRK